MQMITIDVGFSGAGTRGIPEPYKALNYFLRAHVLKTEGQ